MNSSDEATSTRSYRMPAEWEPVDAVLTAWPHSGTDWNHMLDEAQTCFGELIHAIARHARVVVCGPELESARKLLSDIPPEMIIWFECPTDDTWTRDCGPICTIDSRGRVRANDFVFNGWGLKFASAMDNRLTRHMAAASLLDPACLANRLDFVLEGGSIDSDGRGTLLTTSECLLSSNRNAAMDRSRIERILCERLGADRVLWLDHGYLAGDDTDSHIDTLARFAPHDTIIYTGCADTSDEHFGELNAMARQLAEFTTEKGQPYNLIELPLPDPIYDEDGNRLPATYANFLPINDAVLLPVYGQERNDSLAEQMLRIVYPDKTIETVDCRALIRQHGSLHCSTMQLPHGLLTI